MSNLLVFLIIGLIGYISGRIADNYFNIWIGDPWWVPDHWILGFVLMVLGAVYFTGDMSLYIFSFGIGHLISDLNDFFKLKFYGPDSKDKDSITFWDID